MVSRHEEVISFLEKSNRKYNERLGQTEKFVTRVIDRILETRIIREAIHNVESETK